jgi:hypothetical protein
VRAGAQAAGVAAERLGLDQESTPNRYRTIHFDDKHLELALLILISF